MRLFINLFSTPFIPQSWGILGLGDTPKPLAEGQVPSALPISKQSLLSRLSVGGAPCLGQHNEYILKEILGMSDDEVAELLISGALE